MQKKLIMTVITAGIVIIGDAAGGSCGLAESSGSTGAESSCPPRAINAFSRHHQTLSPNGDLRRWSFFFLRPRHVQLRVVVVMQRTAPLFFCCYLLPFQNLTGDHAPGTQQNITHNKMVGLSNDLGHGLLRTSKKKLVEQVLPLVWVNYNTNVLFLPDAFTDEPISLSGPPPPPVG